MAREKVLVVDDEAVMRELLSHYLLKEGFQVFTAGTGAAALELIDREKPDLILLDILLPDLDGLEICRELRRRTDVPVIFVSSKNDSVDVVLGLGLGGDDYVPKPFKPIEVVARVKACLRRHRRPPELPGKSTLDYPGLKIDLAARTVEVQGKAIALTTKEFDILALLAGNPGRYFSAGQLLLAAWGSAESADLRTLMVHISRLRKKIGEDPANPRYIVSARNVGYRFNDNCP